MHPRPNLTAAVLAVLGSSLAMAVGAAGGAAREGAGSAVQPASRGELLYEAHCVECHTAQVHWRERRQARDWATLKAEVIRWQRDARLGWSDADVDAVTQHLNQSIYHFAAPQAQARGTLLHGRAR